MHKDYGDHSVAEWPNGEEAWFVGGQSCRFLDMCDGKHLDRIDKIEAVLGSIGQALGFVPLEFHLVQLRM